MKLRAYAAVVAISVGLLVADLVQRFVVGPWVFLRPDSRIAVLGRWQHLMARFVLFCAGRIGGAGVPQPPIAIESEPGHLILMNHQSLFDIPLVVRTVVNGYPRIVTRKRYGRWIPQISHMARLYQYPLVDASANREELKETLDSLSDAGRDSDVPIVVFPEGTRTRDGSIGRFRSAGVARLLGARPWTIHVLVADGFWKAAKFADLAEELPAVEGTFGYGGSIEWTDPTADPAPVLREVRQRMIETLEELRGARSPA